MVLPQDARLPVQNLPLTSPSCNGRLDSLVNVKIDRRDLAGSRYNHLFRMVGTCFKWEIFNKQWIGIRILEDYSGASDLDIRPYAVRTGRRHFTRWVSRDLDGGGL